MRHTFYYKSLQTELRKKKVKEGSKEGEGERGRERKKIYTHGWECGLSAGDPSTVRTDNICAHSLELRQALSPITVLGPGHLKQETARKIAGAPERKGLW